jgi:hypothetical protein
MQFAGNCLYVNDVGAALNFYRRAFGFESRFYDPATSTANSIRDGRSWPSPPTAAGNS